MERVQSQYDGQTNRQTNTLEERQEAQREKAIKHKSQAAKLLRLRRQSINCRSGRMPRRWKPTAQRFTKNSRLQSSGD